MTTLNLDHFLPYRLSVASNRVSNVVATTYQAMFGLRIPEWRLVAVLAEGQGMTQHALGARTRMDKVSVSRAAIALVDRGLIERSPNPGDQRSHILKLSDAGQALYEQVAPKAIEMEARLFGEFGAGELEQLRRMLDRLESAAAALEPEQA